MSATEFVVVAATVELDALEVDVLIELLGDHPLDYLRVTFDQETREGLSRLRDRLSLYLRLLNERDAVG